MVLPMLVRLIYLPNRFQLSSATFVLNSQPLNQRFKSVTLRCSMGGTCYRSRHLDRALFAISKGCSVHPSMYMSVRREPRNSTRELGDFTVELRNFEIIRHSILKSIFSDLNFDLHVHTRSAFHFFLLSHLQIEMSYCSKSSSRQYSKSN